jgi:predicted aldo/keto reductase-like oxidoreductase
MEAENKVSRRGFLKKTGFAVVGGGVISGTPKGIGAEERQGQDQEVKIRATRTLGRTGFQVSDIGFGTGSLNNPAVLAVALDMGVNYIDTAEHYVNGQAERTVGEVLKDRDRSSIFLTTKLNMSMGGSSKEQIKERFQRCLERMQTDRVDCLMVHMTPAIEQVTHEGFHAAAAELKQEGKVRFLGLSNHGTQHSIWGQIEDPMEKVIGAAAEDGRFDVALFVYNFLQKEQGERIIQACASKKVGVTLMKTDPVALAAGRTEALETQLRSGREVPESRQQTTREYQAWADAAEEFKRQHGLQSATQVRDAAIKFVLDNPGVHSVCPTINTFEALEGFVALSGQKLSTTERPMLASYEDLLGPYYCRHACGICEPSCPRQVPVNTILRYDHYYAAQGREKQAMQKYAGLSGPTAGACADCPGHCESACPFGVRAKSLLAQAHENLTMA